MLIFAGFLLFFGKKTANGKTAKMAKMAKKPAKTANSKRQTLPPLLYTIHTTCTVTKIRNKLTMGKPKKLICFNENSTEIRQKQKVIRFILKKFEVGRVIWASDTICQPFIYARFFLLFSTRVFVFHGLALRPPCR